MYYYGKRPEKLQLFFREMEGALKKTPFRGIMNREPSKNDEKLHHEHDDNHPPLLKRSSSAVFLILD